MKVATWRGGGKFTVDQVPDPPVGPGLVLVKVHSAGVCGSEIHMTQGLFPGAFPAVLGHEFSGTIVEVGDGVPAERIGEKVACVPQPGCGECAACRSWSTSHCERLPRGAGSFAEYVLAAQEAAFPIPAGLSVESAAMTEPASCVLSTVDMAGGVDEGCDALVVGGGLLGQFTVALLKLRGAARVILSEPHPVRREMGRQFGADVLHDPAASDLGELIGDYTGGKGVGIAAEAVGKPDLVARCVRHTRPRGRVLLVGVSPQGAPLPVDLFDMHYREITIGGAFGAGNSFEEALRLLPQINLSGVVAGRFRLEDIGRAFEMSAAGQGVKFMIAPHG